MRIDLEYHDAVNGYCGVGVSIDGDSVGDLWLRQRDTGIFQDIIVRGCIKGMDVFTSRGSDREEVIEARTLRWEE
jgi:hypothetical protein